MAAGYKDFTAGAILTAADLEDYNQNQSIMRFASAAARDTALSVVKTEGMFAYLIDVNTVTVYTGAAWSTIGPILGAWIAYTPTWSGTLGNGTVAGAYQRIGRTVNFRASVIWGSTTSHAAAVQSLTLPFTPVGYLAFQPLGQSAAQDSGVNVNYGSMWYFATNVVNFGAAVSVTGGVTSGQMSNTVPFTWGNADSLLVQGCFEAAADA